MLSVQPLHAIVLGLCEKVGRHDGTWLWHGTATVNREEQCRGGGRGGVKIHPVPVTHSQGSQLS